MSLMEQTHLPEDYLLTQDQQKDPDIHTGNLSEGDFLEEQSAATGVDRAHLLSRQNRLESQLGRVETLLSKILEGSVPTTITATKDSGVLSGSTITMEYEDQVLTMKKAQHAVDLKKGLSTYVKHFTFRKTKFPFVTAAEAKRECEKAVSSKKWKEL